MGTKALLHGANFLRNEQPLMRSAGALSKPLPPGFVWMVATCLSVLFGQLLQSSVHLNHDVSWIAHTARWLLEGKAFGVDVIDPNPPLIWWLSLPTAMLVKWCAVGEPLAARLVFWAYFLTSAGLLFVVQSRLERNERAAAAGWRIAFIAVATLAPAASFGQREYLSVLFAMPYLAAAAVRLQGRADIRGSILAAVGFLAGIGFALKPYFLAVPLLVEGMLVARLGWRSIFRVESLAIGITILAYALLIVFLVPQYLSFTIPLMRAIYWAFDSTNYPVLVSRYRAVAEPFAYGAVIALLARCWTRQHSVMLLAGVGYSFSYFIQAKGFVYHAFPVLTCAIVFLGISVASGLSRVHSERQSLARPLLLSLIAGMIVLTLPPIRRTFSLTADWYVQYNTTWGDTGRFRDAVIALVDRYAPTPDSYFFAFSMHLFPGFPTASYTKAEWSSRSATQGLLAAYARRDELTDPALIKRVLQAAELQRRMIIEEFEVNRPSIVLLERSRVRFGMNGRQFDDLAFYMEDPRFAPIWSQYEELQPLGPLRVFVLRGRSPSRG